MWYDCDCYSTDTENGVELFRFHVELQLPERQGDDRGTTERQGEIYNLNWILINSETKSLSH